MEQEILVENIKYRPFKLTFSIPQKAARMDLQEREFILIKLVTNKGIGLGEASPLPNFSKENPNDIIKFLAQITSPIRLERLINSAPFPSLKFAFEEAAAMIEHSTKNSYRTTQIKTNGFIPFLKEQDFIEAIENLLAKNYTRIKIKIGRKSFEEDLHFLQIASEIIGDKALMRIDVNGKWEIDNALGYLNRLKKFNIEYVEQPVAKCNELIRLAQISPLPIAADESLVNPQNIPLLLKSKVAVFILKPMLLGGVGTALKIYKSAKEKGKSAIFSTLFEGPVGLTYLIYGASQTDENLIHGIPPFGFKEIEGEKLPFKFGNGIIIFDNTKFSENFLSKCFSI